MQPTAHHSQTGRLRRERFDSWRDYYWAYQYRLAIRFYLPLLEEWGVTIAGHTVLDIGCGNGGFVAGFADNGARCTGVEIRDFRWPVHENVRFVVADITDPHTSQTVGESFDLIVLRDVIEHIPREKKTAFLSNLRRFGTATARFFVTFPPYYSPFGLHQQTVLKSFLKRVPFLHFLPRRFLFFLMHLAGESDETRRRIAEVMDCGMTVRSFREIIMELAFSIHHERFYLVRPSHEIRYGWKARTLRTCGTRLIDEMRILGAAFLLGP